MFDDVLFKSRDCHVIRVVNSLLPSKVRYGRGATGTTVSWDEGAMR